MADTTVHADNQVTVYESDYWMEYVRESGFMQYMSTSVNAIIQTNRELIAGGKDIIIPLIGALTGKGTGTGKLVGNEQKIDNFAFRSRPYWRRQAVTVKESERQKTFIDLLKAQKDVLKLWSSDDLRDCTVDALSVVAEDDNRYDEENGIGRQVPYAEATATQRNTFLTNNAWRVLFGNSEANLSAGNFAASLANVNTSTGKWSAATIDKAKKIARTRDKATGRRMIRPWKNGKDGKEFYILFVTTDTMTELRNDATIQAFNKDARPREVESNPGFQDGDLVYRGVIIHEIPELPSLGAVGGSSANVDAGYLCGAQALVVCWGKDPTATKRTEDDYQFITGVGTKELRSVDKTFFNNMQHGVVSIFAARS